MQNQLPARVTFVPVICASEATALTNFSDNQHACLLNHTIDYIQRDICLTPNKRAGIHIRLIPSPQEGTKNCEEAWNSAVRTRLAPPRNHNLNGCSLKRDCAVGFQRQCDPLSAAWLGYYPE